MKKTILALMMVVAVVFTTNAGGILTNTNQSAQWVRMLSRNASTQIDAVYYNPAGLANLKDGFHFSLNNQSIFQQKIVNSKFPLLNDGEYIGDVKAPVFPTAYAVWKKDMLAFSLGFGPNAGGGSATFERGLPSFEIPITKLVPGLAGLNLIPAPGKYAVTGYDADLYFTGKSVFWGLQLGATIKFNDMLSWYTGLRYMPSKNTYEGHIHDIKLNVNGTLVPAATWMTGSAVPTISGIAAQASGAATTYTGAANSVQQLITAGAGTLTLAQVQTNGFITSAQKAQFEGALTNLGKTSAEIAAMNMNTIKALYSGAATSYANSATQLTQTAGLLTATAAGLGNKEVKTEQTGAGWTPIVGVNMNLSEMLNIAVKYEFKTKLTLTNNTEVDDLGLFPDGTESRSDIPAILAVGVGFRPAKFLETQLSYNLYFDKGVEKNPGWGQNVRDLAIYKSLDATKIRTRGIDKNMWELALGLQFNVSDNLSFSVGGLNSQSGVADSYQSDFSYSLSAVTGACGIQWKATDNLTLDLGVMNSWYKDSEVSFTDPVAGVYTDTYGKKNWGFAVGLSYSIFK
jgi:long-chain fatty acid transport protein